LRSKLEQLQIEKEYSDNKNAELSVSVEKMKNSLFLAQKESRENALNN